MNKMQSLAKVLMAVLGLYILFHLFKDCGVIFSLVQYADLDEINMVKVVIISILYLAIYIIFIYQLLFKGDKWSRKIVSDTLSQDDSQPDICWLTVSYRLAAFVCGIIILFWTLPAMINFVVHIFVQAQYGELVREQHKSLYRNNTIVTILRLAISIYLICGAPHIVRWQVKKSLVEQA